MKELLFVTIATISASMATPGIANLAIVCDQHAACWRSYVEDFTTQAVLELFQAKNTPIILSHTLALRVLYLMLLHQQQPIKHESVAELLWTDLDRNGLGGVLNRHTANGALLPLDPVAHYAHTGHEPTQFCQPQRELLDTIKPPYRVASILNLFRFVIQQRDAYLKQTESHDFPDNFLLKADTLFDPSQWFIYAPAGGCDVVLFVPRDYAGGNGLNTDRPELLRPYHERTLADLISNLSGHDEQQNDIASQIIGMIKPNQLQWNVCLIGPGAPADNEQPANWPTGNRTHAQLAGMPISEFKKIVTYFATNHTTRTITWCTDFGGGLMAHDLIATIRTRAQTADRPIPITISAAQGDTPLNIANCPHFKTMFKTLEMAAVAANHGFFSDTLLRQQLFDQSRDNQAIIAVPNTRLDELSPHYRVIDQTRTAPVNINLAPDHVTRLFFNSPAIEAPIKIATNSPMSTRTRTIAIEIASPAIDKYQIKKIKVDAPLSVFLCSAFFAWPQANHRQYPTMRPITFNIKLLSGQPDPLFASLGAIKRKRMELHNVTVIRAAHNSLHNGWIMVQQQDAAGHTTAHIFEVFKDTVTPLYQIPVSTNSPAGTLQDVQKELAAKSRIISRLDKLTVLPEEEREQLGTALIDGLAARAVEHSPSRVASTLQKISATPRRTCNSVVQRAVTDSARTEQNSDWYDLEIRRASSMPEISSPSESTALSPEDEPASPVNMRRTPINQQIFRHVAAPGHVESVTDQTTLEDLAHAILACKNRRAPLAVLIKRLPREKQVSAFTYLLDNYPTATERMFSHIKHCFPKLVGQTIAQFIRQSEFDPHNPADRSQCMLDIAKQVDAPIVALMIECLQHKNASPALIEQLKAIIEQKNYASTDDSPESTP